MGRDYSRIVSIAPKTYHSRVLFDGRDNDFYSCIRGSHQITPSGSLLVTSPQQGRVFEIAMDGNLALEIYNREAGGSKFNYVISQAIWLPVDAFDVEDLEPCSS